MTKPITNPGRSDVKNDCDEWWLAVDNNVTGPFGETAIRLLLERQKIDHSTLACSVTGTEWKALSSFPAMHPFISLPVGTSTTSSSRSPNDRTPEVRSIAFYGTFIFPIWTGIAMLLGVCAANKTADSLDRVMNWWGWCEAIVEVAFAFWLSKSVTELKQDPILGLRRTMTCLGTHLAVTIFEVLVTSLLLVIGIFSSADNNPSSLNALGVSVLVVLVLGNLTCFIFEAWACYSLWVRSQKTTELV